MPNKSAIKLITAEISALESLLETIDESFDHATDLIANCSGKIIVVGIMVMVATLREVVVTMDIKHHLLRPLHVVQEISIAGTRVVSHGLKWVQLIIRRVQ